MMASRRLRQRARVAALRTRPLTESKTGGSWMPGNPKVGPQTKITDNGLRGIKALTKLRSLGLEDTQVTDRGLEHLKVLDNLRILCVNGSKVTDEGVKKLELALPELKIRTVDPVEAQKP